MLCFTVKFRGRRSREFLNRVPVSQKPNRTRVPVILTLVTAFILPPIYHFGPDFALFIYIFQYLALFTYICRHLALFAPIWL